MAINYCTIRFLSLHGGKQKKPKAFFKTVHYGVGYINSMFYFLPGLFVVAKQAIAICTLS